MAVVFVVRLSYLYYRPASAEQLRLVGAWRQSSEQGEIVFELTEDRRMVTAGIPQPGKWSATDGVFHHTTTDWLSEARRALCGLGSPRGVETTFDDTGDVTWSTTTGPVFRWERIAGNAD